MEQFRTKLENSITKVSNACKVITVFDWALLGVLCAFVYSTMLFDDLIITYSHGLCFWDCLFSGEIANFYPYAKANSWEEWTACYYLPLYVIFAVWNLPIWLLSKVVTVDLYAPGFLLWAKGMNLFFVIVICILICRILKEFEIGKEMQKGIIFLFVSSLNLILPTWAMGQYDIVCCFFLVWGLYEYCKAPRISWKCLLIFAIAVTMKLFAIFAIIPLILLKEKRIMHIIKNLIIVLSGLFLCVMPYREVFAEASVQSNFNNMWRDRLLFNTLPGGNSAIPCFVLFYGLICIWAYYKTCNDSKEECIHANWVILASLLTLFVFVFCHPQWIVLITPFLTMLVALNGIKINYLLDLFLNIGISVYYCYYFNWVYGTELAFKYMLFKGIPYNERYHNMAEIVDAHGFTVYMSSFFAVFVACAIALLVINMPKKEYVKVDCEVEANYLRLRLLPILAYILGTVLIAYIR